MSRELLELIAVSGLSAVNVLILVWQTFKRLPSEVRKMEAERFESFTEAVESSLQSAQISNALLLARNAELKQARDNWRSYAYVLRAQVKALDAEPIPFDTGELNKENKE